MYTILVRQDNSLIASVRERIMQRSKLVDSLHFLVDTKYKDEFDMSDFSVTLEYILPISKEYVTEMLVKSEDLYKFNEDEIGKLEYKLPFDTSLTKESGDIEIQLTFAKIDIDDDGNDIQYIRKTSTTTIHITPIAAWSDIIPDKALTAIDQRIIKTEAMINELNDMNKQLINTYDDKADGLSYENNELQLTSKGNKIGNKIIIDDTTINNIDGNIRVIEF